LSARAENRGHFEAVIGLEVHAQLATSSKIFCGCRVEFGAPPNSLTCPVCQGLPGALPVLNKKAVEYAVRMILATGGTVNQRSIFARKNYFYPDLPKGYQISQHETPLGIGGSLVIPASGGNDRKVIRLKRVHLEEDAGKSLHPEAGENYTRIDLNRCGTPLIEIVTEPDIKSPHEAYAYLVMLKQILQYLEICTGDMEKGHLRCDANISVRPAESPELGTRTELKNLNSFRWVERALAYEIERQTKIIESGAKVEQLTLLWNEKKQIAEPMRSKEESHDYRYFPEPDLVNLVIDDDWLKSIKVSLPELPEQRAARFVKQYQIPEYDAGVLTSSRGLADYYETVMKGYSDGKTASNWIMTEIMRVLNEEKSEIESFRLTPQATAELLNLVKDGTVSGKIAKEIFAEMLATGLSASEVLSAKGLTQISDSTLISEVIERVLAQDRENLRKYLSGKTQIFGYFVGAVMKETKGKANPALVNKLLKEKLDALAR
jgi:aspartyl-tRNA(Asn)/glutamyl-tRNA(Gln) amidotransferase subunit B